MIEADRITVAGAIAAKPARLVAPDEPVEVLGPPARFVGRGGEKLAAALERFCVDVDGRRALDAGASTGGFTDCLLQAGAAEVWAIDVGRGQLHPRLREDPRVRVHERTDIRLLTVEAVGGAGVDVVTVDLSFISLRAVIGALADVSGPTSDWVLLVKPQFEAGRAEAARARGVITDPAVWRRTVAEVAAAVRTAGVAIMGVMASPILGGHGNAEFLLHARRGGTDAPDVEASVDEAIAAATEAGGVGG